MKKLLAVILLSACAGAPGEIKEDVSISVPAKVAVGHWCNEEGECLTLHDTSFGPNWMIYSWALQGCAEGGFAEVQGQQLLFSGIYPDTGCFSKVSATYTATFGINSSDILQVQLSVQDQPLLLQRK